VNRLTEEIKMTDNKMRYGVKIIITKLIIILTVVGMSCSNKKDAINNIDSEITNIVTENAGEKKLEADETFEKIIQYSQENDTLEDDANDFPIPATLEEALDIMDRLNIENIVLERIIINGETYTAVEVTESGLTVGTDAETNIYDIPDKSGNILFTIPYKNEIQATVIAIIEEPSLMDWGVDTEHWVKIRIADGTIGWVRGEYTGINRGGIKYRTRKNIWLEENYYRHWI
jgi:predicted transcriptional regulator